MREVIWKQTNKEFFSVWKRVNYVILRQEKNQLQKYGVVRDLIMYENQVCFINIFVVQVGIRAVGYAHPVHFTHSLVQEHLSQSLA